VNIRRKLPEVIGVVLELAAVRAESMPTAKMKMGRSPHLQLPRWQAYEHTETPTLIRELA
jgi:hypothetical protein